MLIDDSSYDALALGARFVRSRGLELGGRAVPKVVSIEQKDDEIELTLSFVVGLKPDVSDLVFAGLDRDNFVADHDDPPETLPCCICGRGTKDAFDYVQITVTSTAKSGHQVLGAHATCLNDVMAERFKVTL